MKYTSLKNTYINAYILVVHKSTVDDQVELFDIFLMTTQFILKK